MLAGALFAGGTAFDAFGATGTWTDGVEEACEALGAVILLAVFAREAGGLAAVHRLVPRNARDAESERAATT
jgi:hypothetical protein